mgnify:CR=1 FL=1
MTAPPRTGFTFYCSSIKSLEIAFLEARREANLHSTVVLLKVLKYSSTFRSNSSFTFYCSSIKSFEVFVYFSF